MMDEHLFASVRVLVVLHQLGKVDMESPANIE